MGFSRGRTVPLQLCSRLLATDKCSRYPVAMLNEPPALTPDELRRRLHPFCERHRIRRLEVFGSAAHGQAGPSSDVDLLVTFDDSVPVSTGDLLEMAGEAEELVGRPIDFVLRPFLEKSPNCFAREHILATAVCLYGD
jgi:predicted nucleotidyltransferase